MAGATTTALTLDQERRHARAMQDTRSAETQRAAAPSTTVLVPTVAVHRCVVLPALGHQLALAMLDIPLISTAKDVMR